ncbi:FKBP-type peptidyl-prolyl cis-trans isomerase [Candidatus Saccharibacteria bacterium]|nr:FKBP-type peptidyl-prolyl cis-trans isomerase [Candidatus Saccharibacteria bacterium]
MQEKELKTSVGQRVAISIIAFFMLGSIIASYAAILVSNNKSSESTGTTKLSSDRIAYYQSKYSEKLANFKEVSKKDFEKFKPYTSEIKAYNETSANESGVQTRDIVKGDGRTIDEKDDDYLAYYVGWCADESIFDSSLDNNNSPSAFAKALDISMGMIEGWYIGAQGMKLGGIREITIPGELAYGDQTEICGGKNKPLRFLIMAVPAEDPLKTASSEVDSAYMQLQYANYGIDYEKEMAAQASSAQNSAQAEE